MWELLELGLSDLPNKNTGYPVKFECQINDNFKVYPKYCFSDIQIMGHVLKKFI